MNFQGDNILNTFASSVTTGARADIVTAFQTQSTANGTLTNNFIATNGGTGGVSDRAIFGMLDLSGATMTYQFNSVNIFGTATMLNNTYAFNRNIITTVTLRNNIFADTRTGGAGFHVAMANTNAAATGWMPASSDFNLLWNVDPTHVTQWLGALAANNLTLPAFVGASGGDIASSRLDPMFVAPVDLHLLATSPAIATGTPFGSVAIDFDMDPRPAAMPDRGADEVVQAVAGSIPAGTYYNALGAGGDTLGGNVMVTNNLALTGIVTTGANTLTLGCAATVTGASATNFVVGNFAKQYCAVGSFTYPVGDNTGTAEYSPFTANVTALATNPSTLTVSVTDGVLPGSSPTQSASRYWDVTETGDLTADISMTYLDPADVMGTEASYLVLRREAGITAVFAGGSVNTVTDTATAPGVTMFSQWGAGNLAPLAAGVNVGGRVVRTDGQGISRARVTLTDSNGTSRTTLTGSFGYYNFEDVDSGQTVTVSVADKRYIFNQPVQVINVGDSVTNADFIASGENNLLNGDETYFDKAPIDFDGDGRTDISVFRAAKATWFVNQSSNNTMTKQAFGLPSDVLVPADFDGDGKTDYAVFRRSEGNWYIWSSLTNELRVERHGVDGDVPCPVDFDGDKKADLIVWNGGNGTWSVKQSSNDKTVEVRVENTDKTSVPMVADYDTDGKADLTIYVKSSGTWRILLSSTGETVDVKFGGKGVATMGDYDGDARADFAIFNDGVWTIRNSRTGEITRTESGAGVPVVGDYDGDGRLDTAVFGGGRWTIKQSASGFVANREFGNATDIGLPSIFVR